MTDEIRTSVQWLAEKDYLPADLRIKAIKLGLVHSREVKAISYQPIRDTLWANVYDAVYDFLNSRQQSSNAARMLATKVSQAYIETADIAYVDGGGSLPMDEDTVAWARSELSAQLDYVDGLFENLKQMRKEGDFDAIGEAFRRADGYSNSLDAFYNSVKVAGAGNKMLTFGGSDGKESCRDCHRLKGQRHRASWWKSHNWVPPSHEFECGGYHCEHRLIDDEGNVFTI